MISRDQLQGLIERRANGKQILSAYVDMSVNEENKRTWDIWLSKRKAEWRELASDRPGHHREEIGAAFARLERFLGDEFDQANKGAAMFIELGGDWSEAIQLPLPLANRLGVVRRIVLTPELGSTRDMLRLSRCLLEEGARHLQLFLHSPTLEPGLTPYTPTRRDVDRLYATIEAYLEGLARIADIEFATMAEAEARFGDAAVADHLVPSHPTQMA